jgi:hypothetical protein
VIAALQGKTAQIRLRRHDAAHVAPFGRQPSGRAAPSRLLAPPISICPASCPELPLPSPGSINRRRAAFAGML